MGSVKVRVVYFGIAKDIAGRREEEFALDAPASVEDLLSETEKKHAGLRRLRGLARVAVNEELTGDRLQLLGGERVAILPPVAGG